jgi:hypothetical protein
VQSGALAGQQAGVDGLLEQGVAKLVAVLTKPGHQQLLGHRRPQRLGLFPIAQAGDGGQQPMGHPPAGHRGRPEHVPGRLGQRLDAALQQVPQGLGQRIGARPHRRQQLLGEERVALRAGEHGIHQVGGRRRPKDCAQLGQRLGPLEARQLQTLDRTGPAKLGQVGPRPRPPGLVAAVGDHQQHPLAAQVSDQERQQVAGRAVGPVQVLDHQQQRCLLAEAADQTQQQLEQARLRVLAGRASGLRFAEGGEQAGKLWPGRADEPAHRVRAELGDQRPQHLHDRGIRQGPVGHRHAAAAKHPGGGGGATSGQLGDQARLADAGFAPQQDDGRFAGCGPHPGRLEDIQLLDAADECRARHAAAHLAGIIAPALPQGNGASRRATPKIGNRQAQTYGSCRIRGRCARPPPPPRQQTPSQMTRWRQCSTDRRPGPRPWPIPPPGRCSGAP